MLSNSGRIVNSCLAVADIIIPEGVTEIGEYAFCGSVSLKDVTISEGVTTIGDFAFNSCRLLQSITVPDSVTKIGADAFKGSYRLQSINVPRGSRQRFIKMLGKEYASKIKEIDL